MLAAVLLWACAAVCLAQSGPTKQFHIAIDAGARAAVLKQFSEQTGLQVITQFELAGSETHQLGPFVGDATADAAMTALLKNTDLSYAWQDDSTITVAVTVVRAPRAEDNVQEVTVTNTRIPGESDTPSPVRVFGNGAISRYGVGTMPDLTRYLTQQPFSLNEGSMQSGAQFAQMRGLGYDTTLVLINGRRVPPSANSIALNAVDLNNVPMAAVERIEVMPDSASALYGADAVGGVINIILHDKIERPQIYLHYGQADGGGEQRRAAALIGANNYRGKATLVLDYYETTALLGAERDLWRNQDYRRYGGLDYRVSASNPGNVYSLTGKPLPGLSSSRAAVPLGTTGQLTPADFFATDGATNLASSFSNWSITPPSRRMSAYVSAEYSFAEDLQLFGEWLAESSELTTLRAPPSVSRQIVPAWNPFNPFGVAVAVDYSFADLAPVSYLNDTDLLRMVGGARGTFNGWNWEISAINHSEHGRTLTRGEIDRALLASAVNSADPTIALNLFAVGPPAPSEQLESLLAPSQQLSFAFSTSQFSAFAHGPLFHLYGRRPAELLIGAEWRHDTAGFVEMGKHVDAGRNISSVFSELRVPLIDTVSLKIAARADDYGAAKWIVNPQYGLTWRPTREWLLRASYGTSFRPPSLFELYMPTYQPTFLVADPLRGGELSTINLIVGGNRGLQAVTARSFSAGFAFTPDELPGLRIGASYWSVAMNNRIIVPNYQELLKLDSAFPDRVVRDVPNEQDAQSGSPGRLRSMNLLRINYGDLQTRGIDFDTSLTIGTSASCIKLDLAVTWIDAYRSHDLNQMLPVDRVGIANLQGTIPEWRIVGGVTWKLGRFGASTTATFVPSYRDADFWTGPLDRRIGSQTLVDLQTWMELGGVNFLEGATFSLGARNLFDQQPEFANAGASAGYDMSQSTLTGRLTYLRLSKRF